MRHMSPEMRRAAIALPVAAACILLVAVRFCTYEPTGDDDDCAEAEVKSVEPATPADDKVELAVICISSPEHKPLSGGPLLRFYPPYDNTDWGIPQIEIEEDWWRLEFEVDFSDSTWKTVTLSLDEPVNGRMYLFTGGTQRIDRKCSDHGPLGSPPAANFVDDNFTYTFFVVDNSAHEPTGSFRVVRLGPRKH